MVAKPPSEVTSPESNPILQALLDRLPRTDLGFHGTLPSQQQDLGDLTPDLRKLTQTLGDLTPTIDRLGSATAASLAAQQTPQSNPILQSMLDRLHNPAPTTETINEHGLPPGVKTPPTSIIPPATIDTAPQTYPLDLTRVSPTTGAYVGPTANAPPGTGTGTATAAALPAHVIDTQAEASLVTIASKTDSINLLLGVMGTDIHASLAQLTLIGTQGKDVADFLKSLSTTGPEVHKPGDHLPNGTQTGIPSFDMGGSVIHDMIAQLHAGEEVSSPDDVRAAMRIGGMPSLKSMTAPSTGSGANVTVHAPITINGVQDPARLCAMVADHIRMVLPRTAMASS